MRSDGAPVRPGAGIPRRMSRLSKPAKQSGTRFADTIRASGHEKGRINRPDTRLHPTSRQNIKSSLATREPSTQDISGSGRNEMLLTGLAALDASMLPTGPEGRAWGPQLRGDPSFDLETADERTIRLLNEEVALLRRRAAHSDKSIRRVEAIADAAAAHFAERNLLASKEIALLRKRVSNAHQRERGLKQVAKASSARSAERGAMLHEVNHRAKNSIQIAISLLNLQRQASADPQVRLSLANAVERLGHIARVHSMLYARTPDQQVIDFGEYLKTFCAELREALAGDVDVVCAGSDELTVDPSRAVNLALITSEGVTNAVKHAFPNGQIGTVTVDCRTSEASGVLTIRDNGIGMTESTGKDTMGLKLVRTLVKGIEGKLRIDRSEGTRLQVTFPL